VNLRGGGTVILPTEEPTVQQSNQSTAAPEQTGEDAPASPSATAEASADPSATPVVTADPSAAPTPATDAEETPVPEATTTPEAMTTPEATADPSAAPSSASVLKVPMMAPAAPENTTVSQEDAVAQIGDTYYSSLPDAVSAANGGDTIELLKDLDISSDSRWYIEFNKTDTENNPVTIDFNNKSITFHMAGYYGNGNDTRKDFLVMENGQLILENGTLHGIDLPSLKMMGDYQDGQTADDVQKETKLTCNNMNIDHFKLVGYAGKVGSGDPGNMHPDWRHLFVQKSILNECIFDGISASITDSLVNNAEYSDYSSYLCNLDFDGSILESDDSNKYPLNPSTKATFSDTLTINTLSARFVPGEILWDWDRGDDLTDPFWGASVNSYSSSFMDFATYDGEDVSSDQIYLISNTPTKFIGQNNNGYSFATMDTEKVLASQDIPTMAKGVTHDQDDNPTSSADKYMFVPGDAEITLETPDFPNQDVNIEFSYSADGYKTKPMQYMLRNNGKEDKIPVPAWIITGYDQDKREIQKQETSFDQLVVTCSTGDKIIDDEYEFITTYSKEQTHFSIHIKAVKKGEQYTFNFNGNAADTTDIPDPIEVEFGTGMIGEPDRSAKRRGYRFVKWYLDKECTIPFEYFDHMLDKDVIADLTLDGVISQQDTVTLYAGWEPESEPTPTPSTPASASTNNSRGSIASTSNGSIYFPITSARKIIPSTGVSEKK